MRSKELKENPTVKIEASGRGYFTMTVDGVFEGNYDTIQEALADYEETRTAS